MIKKKLKNKKIKITLNLSKEGNNNNIDKLNI